MRIFLSFNSKDIALAESLRAGLKRLEPGAEIFFSPVSLSAGFWMPKLAKNIIEADAFLLLIGPNKIGSWQDIEYQTAFDRHVMDNRYTLVPILARGGEAPGLPFLRQLNWIEAASVTGDETLQKILAALKGESVAAATPLWMLVNPYRGLEAMTEANADYFYGRSNETAAVLKALAEKPERCPILIGASGVGKSSVAQAGVLSALKTMRWPGTNGVGSEWPKTLAHSREWVFLTMRPGEAPFEELVAGVTRLWQLDARDPDHAALPRKWVERLINGDNKFSDLITATQEELKKKQGEAPLRLMLYLDQGEELYTRALPKDARRFSEVFAEALADRRLSAFASLRADYFDKLQADEPLFKCREHIDVPPFDRKQLNEVVTGPARALSVSFEDAAIAERITDAAAAAPGPLPLLSYQLTDMWGAMVARGDATLRLAAQAIDVGGVLARRADEFLSDNVGQEATLRRLLTLRLASVLSEGEPVRRQTARKECSDAEWVLATQLANHPWRLVVIGERAADGKIIAEVAHEALLRAWPKLVDWLREERDFLVFKGEAERAEKRWREIGKTDRALLFGLDLVRAEGFLPRSEDFSSDVNAFIQQSIAFDRGVKERQLHFQRRVTYGAVAAALVMLLIGALAWVKWGEADRATSAAVHERDKATAEEARADAELKKAQVTQSLFLVDLARQQNEKGDFVTAILLALEALPDAKAVEPLRRSRPYVPTAQLRVEDAWRASRELFVLGGHEGPVRSAVFSPDGKTLLTMSNSIARLWDAASGKEIELRRGHEGPVIRAVFSQDGKTVLTASSDKTARLWDAAGGQELAVLRGHEGTVYGAVFSPDGKTVLTRSEDKTARLWDAASGRELAVLRGHEGIVYGAVFSPDGKTVLTRSEDKTARLWDAASGQELAVLRGHEVTVYNAEFSPDGKMVLTSSGDNTARLWDAASGQEIELRRGHEGPVNGAAFSPDGKTVLTSSEDKTARIWDAAVGKEIAVLRGHEGTVNSAVFSPDGKTVLTRSGDKTVRLWDPASGRELAVLRQEVWSAVFSPDGKTVLTRSEDKTARLWDAGNGKEIAVLRGDLGSDFDFSPVFSPDGKTVLTASNSSARLSDVGNGEEIASLRGHKGEVLGAVFSPDGARVLTVSRDGTARLWSTETDKLIIKVLKGHEAAVRSAAYTPDGQRIVTASADKTVRLWDAETGKTFGAPLRGHEDAVNSAAFSPDSKRIVTASADKTVRLWDAETGKTFGAPLRGHEDAVNSAAFSPDGKLIVTASADKTVRLWDAETGTPIGAPFIGHEKNVKSAVFSPDGKRIVTASEDRTARVWDAARGAEIAILQLPKDSEWNTVFSAAFSPDGRQVVVGSQDDTARLWDVANADAKVVLTLRGHLSNVNSAVFSPDGKLIATASGGILGEDNTARLWDAISGKVVTLLGGHKGPVRSVLLSPDGKTVLTASDDKTARLWRVFLTTQELIDNVKQVVPRCLSIAQRSIFFLPPEPPAWCIEMEKWPYHTADWKQWLTDTRAGKSVPLPPAP